MDRKVLVICLIAGFSIVMMALAQIAPPDGGNSTGKLTKSSNTSNQSMNSSNGSYVEGELHVRFDPTILNTSAMRDGLSMKAHAAIGSQLISEYDGLPGLQLVRLPAGVSVQEGIAYYKNISGVLYAEVNAIYSIQNKSVKGNPLQSPKPAGNQSAGDLLVKYNESAFESPQALQRYQNSTNGEINATVLIDYTSYGMPGLQLIQVNSTMTTTQGIAYYQSKPNILYAEPNSRITITANQTLNQTSH